MAAGGWVRVPQAAAQQANDDICAQAAPAGLEMTFCDSFKGDRINTQAWELDASVRKSIKSSRWPENIVVENDMLRLLTKYIPKENKQEREMAGGKSWTAGHLWTRLFRQKYGIFEARIRIAAADGSIMPSG